MSLMSLISTYGYAAVFVGSLLEGEAILLLAGFAAHQGHLSIGFVILIAFVGGTLGDQIFFWIGRQGGAPLLRRVPSVHARSLRVAQLMKRYDAALVFGIRFMYGLRIAGPVAMGALGLSGRRFAIFNALGAAVWAPLVGGAGYLVGHTLERMLGDIERYESALMGGIAAAAVLFLATRHLLHAWRARSTSAPPP